MTTETTKATMIAQAGQFYPLTASTVIPELSGTIAVTCEYRHKKDTPAKDRRDNVYVLVSDKAVNDCIAAENVARLAPYVQGFISDTISTMVKEKHKKGETSVYAESVSLDNVLAYLDAQAESGRLSREAIASWFDASMSDALTAKAITAIGADEETITDEQAAKVIAIVNGYKERYSSLASPATVVAIDTAQKLVKLVEEIAVDTRIGKQILSRLAPKEVKTAELFDL